MLTAKQRFINFRNFDYMQLKKIQRRQKVNYLINTKKSKHLKLTSWKWTYTIARKV